MYALWGPAALPSLNTFHSQREERERPREQEKKKKREKKMCVSHNQNKSHIVWFRRRIRMNNQS